MADGARKARPSYASKTNNPRNLEKPATVTLACSKVVFDALVYLSRLVVRRVCYVHRRECAHLAIVVVRSLFERSEFLIDTSQKTTSVRPFVCVFDYSWF